MASYRVMRLSKRVGRKTCWIPAGPWTTSTRDADALFDRLVETQPAETFQLIHLSVRRKSNG